MVLVEILRCYQLEDRVAEILKALVIARREVRALVGKRAVRDGLEQEAGIAEMDSDLLLKQL
jgi:hypothetical protein